MTLRIGSVPYLNAKPIVDWFHTPECDVDAEVVYRVPSQLALDLEEGRLDTALVSIFEWFRRPEMVLIPGVSISADGPVQSVRLFSRVPVDRIRRVALDTSSLTSVAMTKILLAEEFGLDPEYTHHPPDLDTMLEVADAALIIGDLRLFERPVEEELDLGELWKQNTGLPFVYAAWLARPDAPTEELTDVLNRAREWGEPRLEETAAKWSRSMSLPLDRTRYYLMQVMHYRLEPDYQKAIEMFRAKCRTHGLVQNGDRG
jgi:chorismate dehydratase